MLTAKELLHSSVNDLKRKRYKVDEDILDEIYKNPVIRDLPELATLYGLYSTFVIGQKEIYYVYGFNKELIRHGAFFESRETVIPKDVAERAGYVNFSKDMPFLIGGDYNVERLSDVQENYTYLAWKMMSLEMLKCRYEKYGMEMPQLCIWDPADIMELKQYIDIIDNLTIRDNQAKEAYRRKEKEFLEDIAIWEWPITPVGRKPGQMAFLLASRYAAGLNSDKNRTYLYEHPKAWEKNYLSDPQDTVSTIFRMPADEGDYVRRGLNKMGIPYKAVPKDMHMEEYRLAEAAMLRDVLYKEMQNAGPSDTMVEFCVHKFDIGAVLYWTYQFTKTKFTREELAYGKTLFRSTIRNRMESGETDPEVAAYLFFVPYNFFEAFKQYSTEMNIRFGYPDADWLETDYYDGVYLITEFSNMPVVDHWLHRIMHQRFSMHGVSITGNAPCDERYFHQNQESVLVTEEPWHYKTGSVTARVIEVGSKGIKTGQKLSIPGKTLLGIPTCYAKKDLLKKHKIVDN